MLSRILDHWVSHRTGLEGCRVIGWMRVAYAFLYLVDRLVLGLDLEYFLSPKDGLCPYHLANSGPNGAHSGDRLSLFYFFPQSDWFLWFVYAMSLVNSVLLLLGIYPRVNMFLLHVSTVSFQNATHMLWDGQDQMLRAFGTLFLLQPLHHVTVFDGFGRRVPPSGETSWPMWTVWIWQWNMSLIYFGASWCKIYGGSWLNGDAIYYITYGDDYYPGVFNPDFIFNRRMPLRIVSWSGLIIESLGGFTAWIPSMRIPTILAMFALHLGIEVTMNMHVFEWLTICGWCIFFVQSDPESTSVERHKPVSWTKTGQKLASMVAFLSIFAVQTLDAFPWSMLRYVTADAFHPAVLPLEGWAEEIKEETGLQQALDLTGFGQGMWYVFDGEPGNHNFHFRVDFTFNATQDKKVWKSPEWLEMNWIDRKRHMRSIDYFTMLDEDGTFFERIRLLDVLSRKYAPKENPDAIISLNLYVDHGYAPPPPDDIEDLWATPVRGPREMERLHLLTFMPCRNERADCAVLASNDSNCEKSSFSEGCERSCGLCTMGRVVGGNQWQNHAWQSYNTGYDDEDGDDEEDGDYDEDEDDEEDEDHFDDRDDDGVLEGNNGFAEEL